MGKGVMGGWVWVEMGGVVDVREMGGMEGVGFEVG